MYVFKRTPKAEKKLGKESPTVDCNEFHASNGAMTSRPAYLATSSRLSRNITGFSSKVVDLSSVMDNVSWECSEATYYSFHMEGPEEGEVVGFNVSRTVVDAFLRRNVKSSTVSINVDKEFIEGMEKIVRTASGFRETGF